MENKAKEIVAALEKLLQKTPSIEDHPLLHAEEAIKATWSSLESLKEAFLLYPVTTKKEEINFFKNIKPQITSKLIYYNEIYNIEISKPTGSNKAIQKHYLKELSKLKYFFNENKDFYKYYRTGNTSLDKKYFLRRKHDIRLTLDSNYFQSDYNFATSHDYKVAKIIANEALQDFLETNLKRHQPNLETNTNKKTNTSTLKWTSTKVALVELMYALHTEGVLNQGNLSLNETAKSLETIFNIDLGQFNRIFTEIKNRKTIEQTHFLNTLKENLTKRIEEADKK